MEYLRISRLPRLLVLGSGAMFICNKKYFCKEKQVIQGKNK